MEQYGIRPRGEIDHFGYSRDFFDLHILLIGLLFRHELTPGFKILGRVQRGAVLWNASLHLWGRIGDTECLY